MRRTMRGKRDGKKTQKKQLEEVLRAVKKGDNRAKTKLAWFKLSGHGDAEIDPDSAVVLLEERVKDKDTNAMWMLGLCYEYGMGCEQDLARAEALYNQSRAGKNQAGEILAGVKASARGTGIMTLRLP